MSDKFESQFMADEAKLRHRDKRVSRGMAIILGIWAPFCWVLAAVVGYGNATASNPVPAGWLAPVIAAIVAFGLMFALLAVTFAVLRTVVTDSHVNVKYGLWGPTIALSSITSCKVVDYEWTQFGGWGIRRGLGGKWAYVPGPGEVVEIEYSDDSGLTKIVQIGAEDARKLLLEINRAREALTHRRIEIAEDDVDALAEAEAAATEEAEADNEAFL